MHAFRVSRFLLPAIVYHDAAAPVGFGQAAKVPDWQTAAGGKMSFEVASIRPTKPGEFTPPNFPISADDSYRPDGGVFTADFSVADYIGFAYKLWLSAEQRKTMLVNLPKWVSSDAYEIHAKAEGNPTKDQMRLMMQSLLAERFKLAVHFESQEVPVLAMTLIKPGKTGPKLTPHVDICDHDAPAPAKGAPPSDVFPPPCADGQFIAQPRPNHGIIMGSRNRWTMALVTAGTQASDWRSWGGLSWTRRGLAGGTIFRLSGPWSRTSLRARMPLRSRRGQRFWRRRRSSSG